ncbi:MAG: twin-arginine translocation signal domain-containing protein [Actinomycetota bacterium]|nr:twin-arginine translocation signal domain-containing protein [Actinomycetota bacterium]
MNFSRRHFLAAAGGAVALAACGNSDDSTEGGWVIVQRFPNHPLFTPGETRLPISLADGERLLDNGPDELPGWIEDFTGTKVADIVGRKRKDGIPTPYWEVRAELERAVIYTMRFQDDDGYGATFELFDPADVKTPVTGSAMPGFDTPTVDDHRGVEPFCSLTPDPCPLHAVTLTEALASGKPVAYMVGTPAHCSTGTCTPGLEFLVAEGERVGDAIVMVHADVYADDAATVVAPAVESLGAEYEPIIYFIDATGTVVDRLDAIWDRGELRERIDALLA